MKKFTYMILAGILWGFIGISVKLIDHEINPFSLNFFRFLTAFIILLILSPMLGKEKTGLKRENFKPYIIIGFLFALTSSLFVFAVSRTTISDTVLLQSVQPFFLMFIAYFWLKEKITATKIVTLIIGLVGIYIINPLHSGDFIGNMASLISGALFAVLTAYMRYEDKKMHHTSTLWYMLFATIFMIPFPFIFGIGMLAKNILYVLMLGGLGTGIAYLFYNLALEKMEAEVAALFAMILLPLSSIVLGIIIIGEIPSLKVIIGGIILLGSGVYLELHSKKVRN